MEKNSAKVLDETCNSNNDAYRDEVLYSAWVEPARIKNRSVVDLPTQFSEAVRANVQLFMARLYACQE